MKRLVFLTLLITTINIFGKLPKTIGVCGDGAEWPPFAYFERDNQGKVTKKVVGFSIDILNEVFEKEETQIQFDLLPWKRCLEQVTHGGKYLIAPDSSFSPERAKKFLYTSSYYDLTTTVFYLKKRYPKGFPSFSNAKELLKLGPICGIAGYNYEGFVEGLKNKDLDLGTKNYISLIRKSRLGRCAAFLARLEPLQGFRRLGLDFNKKEIFGRIELRVPKEKFYMLLTKNSPYSTELSKLIEKRLKEMKKSGRFQELWKKYLSRD